MEIEGSITSDYTARGYMQVQSNVYFTNMDLHGPYDAITQR